MKRLCLFAASLLVAGRVSALSAKLNLSEEGKRIVVRVTVSDVGPQGSVRIAWTSPNKFFGSSHYDAPWHGRTCVDGSCTSHTWAYRSLEWTSERGKTYRATGTWRVTVYEVNKDGSAGAKLADGSITVQ